MEMAIFVMKIIRLAFLVCLVLTAAACSHASDNVQKGPTGSSTVSPVESPSGNTGSAEKVQITKEKYDKIKNGMTYKEVIKIVGGKGETITETGEEGSDLHSIGVMYRGKGEVGASATFVFVGNKLQAKSQFRLE
ncbi:DUF3862 domain-containing protein [Paenibacillus roseipurpureus]|uniref:DUF3862 domain-containing protein n=1 Tax=Paenibacillus roseopurpureus TaxID=2918901 RepID=A0AA96LQ26_9BACL|nr:DUF3862 domain-containing protein [Paenibacillus sp. MBLB1832]WNR45158.1 DUF3862 domain-containing protein [Paenibacillus sp. MBLB1832]